MRCMGDRAIQGVIKGGSAYPSPSFVITRDDDLFLLHSQRQRSESWILSLEDGGIKTVLFFFQAGYESAEMAGVGLAGRTYVILRRRRRSCISRGALRRKGRGNVGGGGERWW